MGEKKDFKRQTPLFATPREENEMLGALECPPETNKASISSFGMRSQLHRDPGIFFGIAVDDENPQSYRDIVLIRHYVGRPQSTEGHCAVFGSSRSDKESCIAVPTMVSWGNSPMIVLDPKGDLTEYYMKMRCADKRPIKIFNPARDDTCTYDPFSHIRNDNESNRAANIWELVNAIIPASLDGKDRFWISAAQKILTGVFLYFLDLSDDDTELMDFYTAVDCITSLPFEGKVGEEDGLFERIKKTITPPLKIHRSFMGKHDLSKSEMLMDISETLDAYLMNFINDIRLQKALTPSEDSIDWRKDIDKYSIFLSVTEDRIEQWGPLLNVMITQLIQTLERRPERYPPKMQI